MPSANERYDVVVVGSGIAGLSAAVSARQAGCSRVTVLERAPESEFGGNTRWTEAYMRMKNDSEVSDDFEEHFARNAGWNLDPNVLSAATRSYAEWPPYVKSHGFPDPELISQFASNVAPTIGWLKTFGLRFEHQPIYLLTQNTTRIAAQGGGLQLITTLAEVAKRLGVEFHYRTTAVDLIREGTRVIGVQAVNMDGVRRDFGAGAVVLASGGYQGNPEMMTQYLGAKRAKHIRPVARGGYFNKGEGIRMALKAGAAPAGEFGSYHAEPVDPRSQQAEAVIFIWPYAILVNADGRRFLDEGPGTADATYDEITRTIADQRDGIAFVVFDERVEDIPRWKTSIRSEVPPYESDTLAGLAEKLGLPSGELEKTVMSFNAACPQGGTFEPFRLDGLATRDLWPRKSNWARPLDRPPFRAYPIISANCFTFGGLKVNTNAQVLDADGRVIRGLYAAGETVGIYHQVYTGSTSVLRGAVFGRLAGLHVANQRNANTL